jgi:ankyrin repeat protein
LHYAVLARKANFVIRVKALFENEINNKNEQGNTPFHFACMLGNLDLVQALLVGRYQSKLSKSILRVKSNVEMCPVNKAGLMPIHLAIARSHFFIVHYLLSYETILTTLLRSKFELYRCFKLAISAKAFQILQLLYDVFQEQVDKPVAGNSNEPMRSFWER